MDTQLTPERLKRLKGSALNALADRLMNQDDNYPDDEGELRNYRRRIRAYAFRCLTDRESEEQQASVTLDDLNQGGTAAATASNFAQVIIQNAAAMMDSRTNIHISSADRTENSNFDDEFEGFDDDDDDDMIAEEDIERSEDFTNKSTTTQLHVNTSEEFAPSTYGDLDYASVAHTFMEVLMENTLSNKKLPWKDVVDKTCPLCRADETMSDSHKALKWRDENALENHIFSKEHSPYMKWCRRFGQADPGGRVNCPYCDLNFSKLGNLVTHVQKSTVQTTSQAHEDGKEADGWFDDDFKTVSKKALRKRQMTNLRAAESMGYELPDRKFIQASPHESWPQVSRGSIEALGAIPYHHEAYVNTGFSAVGQIPSHLSNVIISGSASKDSTVYQPGHIDTRFRGVIRTGAQMKAEKEEKA